MSNSTNTGIAVLCVGILLVALSRLLDLGSTPRLVLVVFGAVVTVLGAVLVFRARRAGSPGA